MCVISFPAVQLQWLQCYSHCTQLGSGVKQHSISS